LNGDAIEIPGEIKFLDLIVLSQSCDIENNKIDSILVCPVWDLAKMERELGQTAKEQTKRKEAIRQGKEPGLHMLAGDDKLSVGVSLVEFRRIFTTPKDALLVFAERCGDRLRLLPPYREHLSQAFARYFMRVGLPSDIPSFR
jgi:hypothetical protein